MGAAGSKSLQSEKARHAANVLSVVKTFDNFESSILEDPALFKKHVLLAAEKSKLHGHNIDESVAQLDDEDLANLNQWMASGMENQLFTTSTNKNKKSNFTEMDKSNSSLADDSELMSIVEDVENEDFESSMDEDTDVAGLVVPITNDGTIPSSSSSGVKIVAVEDHDTRGKESRNAYGSNNNSKSINSYGKVYPSFGGNKDKDSDRGYSRTVDERESQSSSYKGSNYRDIDKKRKDKSLSSAVKKNHQLHVQIAQEVDMSPSATKSVESPIESLSSLDSTDNIASVSPALDKSASKARSTSRFLSSPVTTSEGEKGHERDQDSSLTQQKKKKETEHRSIARGGSRYYHKKRDNKKNDLGRNNSDESKSIWDVPVIKPSDVNKTSPQISTYADKSTGSSPSINQSKSTLSRDLLTGIPTGNGKGSGYLEIGERIDAQNEMLMDLQRQKVWSYAQNAQLEAEVEALQRQLAAMDASPLYSYNGRDTKEVTGTVNNKNTISKSGRNLMQGIDRERDIDNASSPTLAAFDRKVMKEGQNKKNGTAFNRNGERRQVTSSDYDFEMGRPSHRGRDKSLEHGNSNSNDNGRINSIQQRKEIMTSHIDSHLDDVADKKGSRISAEPYKFKDRHREREFLQASKLDDDMTENRHNSNHINANYGHDHDQLPQRARNSLAYDQRRNNTQNRVTTLGSKSRTNSNSSSSSIRREPLPDFEIEAVPIPIKTEAKSSSSSSSDNTKGNDHKSVEHLLDSVLATAEEKQESTAVRRAKGRNALKNLNRRRRNTLESEQANPTTGKNISGIDMKLDMMDLASNINGNHHRINDYSEDSAVISAPTGTNRDRDIELIGDGNKMNFGRFNSNNNKGGSRRDKPRRNRNDKSNANPNRNHNDSRDNQNNNNSNINQNDDDLSLNSAYASGIGSQSETETETEDNSRRPSGPARRGNGPFRKRNNNKKGYGRRSRTDERDDYHQQEVSVAEIEWNKEWSLELDQTWAETNLLLRKPVDSHENLQFIMASADAGLMFMEQLDDVSKSLNVSKGALSRWLLPYDHNTRIDEQASTPNSVVENMPMALRGKLTEKQVHYLVSGANNVRRLVRIKIADDNDLEQARTALITSVSFFKMLSQEAEQLKLSPFDLLSKINNEF